MKNTTAGRGDGSAAGKRRFMIRMVTVLIGGMFLDGYILGIIGPVSATMAEDLQISALWEGMIAAAALIGVLLGSPIGGWAADRWGRKPLFTFDIALFTVASGMQVFIDSPMWLLVVRVLMGIAIGIEYSVGWPLMSEFSPTHLRGRLLGAMQIAWYGGFMTAFLIGYLLNEYTSLSWHLILATSTILSVVLFLGRLGLPESPRWLWSRGRKDEARALARKYLASDVLADVEHEDVAKGTFSMLFNKQHWRSTLFISGFWFCAVTPYFAIATFADSVLHQYGLGGGLAGGVGLSAVALTGVVLTFFLIDRVGRRVLTVPPQWLCAVVLAVIGLWTGAPAAVVLALFLVFSFFNAMYNALTGVYPPEVLPTEIRGIGTGFATSVSRVGAGIGTFLMPVSMSGLGAGPTMLIAAVVAVAGAGLSQWLAPETKGMSLTEAAAELTH
ncbi:MFS transporter, putative metabolite transport protein [Rhodococcus koreensis]|uniref:MFS transporter, putative metabolite transport protein n=2 Tax=Rhodococcus koreensis TaxID=99653 RepID=A0A1H4L3K2_9NOCA|nr:MFS transporter, putative metabolite transport protein [Rhodococcus koreensis]SEB65968.1 MFS transporter, putative metabolite transport protein [Rhodococcus koreensis]